MRFANGDSREDFLTIFWRFIGSMLYPSKAEHNPGGEPGHAFLPKPQDLAGQAGEEQDFDPLSSSDAFDGTWLRAAEPKHGRAG